MDPVQDHFGNWWAVAVWVVLYGAFLAFTPFYKKSQRKPASVYLAFVVALALEMFGIPLSMYALAAVIGRTLPDGVLWGHTLNQWIGVNGGMYPAYACYALALVLVVWGWRDIYKHYWSKEEGQGQLVTRGIYGVIRHPQYTGFLLATLGMLFEWARCALSCGVLVWLYVGWPAREAMEASRRAYSLQRRTGMFLRSWGGTPTSAATSATRR